MPKKQKRKGPAPGTVYSEINRTELGQRIVNLRREHGLSQADLANKTGLTKRMISFYEVSAVAIPLERLIRIAEALKVTLDDFAQLQSVSKETVVNRSLLKKLELAKKLPEKKQKLLISIIGEMLDSK